MKLKVRPRESGDTPVRKTKQRVGGLTDSFRRSVSPWRPNNKQMQVVEPERGNVDPMCTRAYIATDVIRE